MKRLMSKFLRISTLACGVCLAQGPQAPDANMSCINRMEIPAYPKLATQARIEGGPFRVSVEVGAAGSAKKISIDSKSPRKSLFEQTIQTAIRRSTFLQSCSGQTVDVVFTFTLSDGPLREVVAFHYPNEFWVTAKAEHWQPQTSQQRD